MLTGEEYVKWATDTYGTTDGRNKRLIYQFGVNDATYVTQSPSKAWACLHNKNWQAVMRRCFSARLQEKKTTYIGCMVSEKWKFFSDFLGWSVRNHVGGWELDKDILFPQNKVYSPETCAYVPTYINALIKQKSKGSSLPMGVTFDPRNKKNPYKSSCGRNDNPFLGMFTTSEAAHKSWQLEKSKQIEAALFKYAKEPAGFRTDVAEALSERVWKLLLDNSQSNETKNL